MGKTNSEWSIPLSSKEKLQNLYMSQVIRPAYSMNTKMKFKFISKLLNAEKDNKVMKKLVFNRFEQQKFMEKYNSEMNNHSVSDKSSRPLFIQFMDQLKQSELPLLKVPGDVPFSTKLVGENPIDAGGHARELASDLVMEMMNEHFGVFTFNPNRRHDVKETNQEDLIPNKFLIGDVFDYKNNENIELFSRGNRFIYAGALIAISVVSSLPQPMKLASFIWEYLSTGIITIQSIYEIDKNFHELIKIAEGLLIRSSNMTDEEFESLFLRDFVINDSFDNIVKLVPSESTKRVTKDNLKEFIELAKNYRIHEFDSELINLKKGFEQIMSFKQIINILRPSELKLLACGESNCSIEQMKKLFKIQVQVDDVDNKDEYFQKMVNMFWNVMNSFSVNERMLFIKFSSGNIGLPAPGTKWNKDLEVNILSKRDNSLAKAHTCFSTVDIPFHESEEELAKILRISINFTGLITDSNETPDAVAEFT